MGIKMWNKMVGNFGARTLRSTLWVSPHFFELNFSAVQMTNLNRKARKDREEKL